MKEWNGKRYHSLNYFLRNKYGEKIYKIPLDGGFTCPNRDGKVAKGGCTFCSSHGSGDFAGSRILTITEQFDDRKKVMEKKWNKGKYIAYFQAYTNTYAPLHELKHCFQPFMERKDVLALSIATRADCLEDDKLAYLHSLCKEKDIWIELGLQSIYDQTAQHCNRGHTYAQFLDCLQRLAKTDIKVAVHLINSLPYETTDMMLESAKALATLPIHALKLHMLHIMQDTQMATEYENQPFPLLSLEDYVDIVIRQLEVLPPEMIIQRLTGDGVKELLIAPTWTLHKVNVLNTIDKEMKRRNTWQGRLYSKS